MTATPLTSQPAAPAAPRLDVTREVRFAVVMYGGVSLAIYINGIAQELLHMVRATGRELEVDGAAALPAAKLKPTERVYRKVSYLLANEGWRLADAERALTSDQPLNTRLVVDIISGTSAGGINGVFLAKALANGQDISRLKDLWVEEGDIAKLINDKSSVERPLTLQQPPASLLNSQRMYRKLLDAFCGMEESNGRAPAAGAPAPASPYVDELDLFVTATDIQGVTLPIRLADGVVHERRHRNVFHFKYAAGDEHGGGRNDFVARNNPFLAFAARCTSAFPFAFEPMSLCDVDEVLPGVRAYCDDRDARSASTRWQPFFKNYLKPEEFPKRPFGDGGYLDNKPFTYATETLRRRGADVPVDRKLVYIEPSPEHPELEPEKLDKPDAVQNTMAALLVLPRYETIREDLQRVLERNRMIGRVNRILTGVEQDAERAAARTQTTEWRPLPDDETWAGLDLADMLKRKGRCYLAYHRLEIAHVTDLLAGLVARLSDVDEDSDYRVAIRSIVRAWRDGRYTKYRLREDGRRDRRPTMNRFLYQMNIQYPLRRLNFLRAKVDQLYRLDRRALDLLRINAAPHLPDEFRPYLEGTAEGGERPIPDELKSAVRAELRRVKSELNAIFLDLRNRARRLQARPAALAADGTPLKHARPASPLYKYFTPRYLESFGLTAGDVSAALKEVLHWDEEVDRLSLLPAEDECDARAAELLRTKDELRRWVNALAKKLMLEVRRARKAAEAGCRRVLLIEPGVGSRKGYAEAVRVCLRHYYQYFDDYDMLSFPILYNSGVGESDVVEIARFSPEDATALVNERDIEGRAAGQDMSLRKTECYKLAGSTLGHFGAFLERRWRESDILWGRLDGAERIIKTILPARPAEARKLIGEAQAAIVWETIKDLGKEQMYQLLIECLMRPHDKRPNDAALRLFVRRLKAGAAGTEWERPLNETVNEREIIDYYLKHFAEYSRPAPEPALRTAARATTVVGKMLEGLSAKYQRGAKTAAWVTRLGRVFWGMVEVAVPRSMRNIVFRHWLKLLYLFEALLIVGGWLLGSDVVQDFGWKALVVTLAVNGVVLLLSDVMRGYFSKWRLTKYLLMLVVAACTLTGAWHLLGVAGAYNDAWRRGACDWLGRRGWFTASAWVSHYWPQQTKSYVVLAVALLALLLFTDLMWRLRRYAYSYGLRLRKLVTRSADSIRTARRERAA